MISLAGNIEALAAPIEERLYFAGEGTNSCHWGCVHSAYESGLRGATLANARKSAGELRGTEGRPQAADDGSEGGHSEKLG